jgi:hypothetical protein
MCALAARVEKRPICGIFANMVNKRSTHRDHLPVDSQPQKSQSGLARGTFAERGLRRRQPRDWHAIG